MASFNFQCIVIFFAITVALSSGRVILRKDINNNNNTQKVNEDIFHPKSPTEKRHINIPMNVPTDIIDLSQRIQRDELINRAKMPAFEALKANVEEKPAEKVAPNLGSLLSGDKVNPLPDPQPIVLTSNESCTEDCRNSNNCTDCECQMPEGAEGCSEGCDMQDCADKQESCDCENETGDSKEEIGELLREKRCCCGCCDCCCCCCGCCAMATMAPAATMAPMNCCCCGCCCCGCCCGCGCCGGY